MNKKRKIKHKSIRGLGIFVSKKEGLKKSVNIAQINEILRILSDESFKYPELLAVLYKNGERRKIK